MLFYFCVCASFFFCVNLRIDNDFFRPWPAFIGCLSINSIQLCPYMLLQLLSMPRTLSTSILLRMSVEAARGLYFVHCCDVVHGNVSSSKYLVDEDLHVKVFCPRSMRYCTEVSDIWEPAFLCCFTSGNNALRSSEAWRQKRLIANKPRDQLL